MIKVALIFFSILMVYSCLGNQDEICFKVKNNSKFKVDSIMVKMGSIALKAKKPFTNDILVELKTEYDSSSFAKNGVGIIYYYSKGKGYWSNFGYFDNKSVIKKTYNLYIYDSGVSEIERETVFLKKNEIIPK